MIEQPVILTGTPAEVEPRLAQYLASHPHATVLSSSVTVYCEPPFAQIESTAAPLAPKKPLPKKAKATDPTPDTPPAAARAFRPIISEPVTIVCIVAGIKL